MNRTLFTICILFLASCGSEMNHEEASKMLFGSSNLENQTKGYEFLHSEYKNGSAYSAGKIGWAYHKGIVVEKDIIKAIELYEFAASRGMTYWQFMLAHAYEMGYFGLEKNSLLRNKWLNYENKVHVASYECWVEYYYREGYYPKNRELQAKYKNECENS